MKKKSDWTMKDVRRYGDLVFEVGVVEAQRITAIKKHNRKVLKK